MGARFIEYQTLTCEPAGHERFVAKATWTGVYGTQSVEASGPTRNAAERAVMALLWIDNED